MTEQSIWHWFTDNSEVISLALSLLMLIVWTIYLQLIYFQFRDARRSSILITRAAGRGMHSRCLITNMGRMPIYVISLIGKLRVGQRAINLQLTDLQEQPGDLGNNPLSKMQQGSLETGEYLNIGHFDEIIERMLHASDEAETEITDVNEVELTVVAFHGWEKLPVGAVRRFEIKSRSENLHEIAPMNVATEQIRHRHARHQLCNRLATHSQ
jgi:hypothetical protein